MNLIESIYQAMSTDDEDNEKESQRLKVLFACATEEERTAIDEAMICICGWSLSTLIDRLTL